MHWGVRAYHQGELLELIQLHIVDNHAIAINNNRALVINKRYAEYIWRCKDACAISHKA